MKLFFRKLFRNPLMYLLMIVPVAIAAEVLNLNSVWVFVLSAIGVIPLAGLIGEATESLAEHTGPKIGGLLNATLGNAAELIITLVAIKAGLLELVKASITGSIIGNLLLVLGFSMLLGGMKNGIQKFDRHQSGNNSVLLTIAVLALVVPSFFSHSIGPDTSVGVEALSIGVAIVMIVLYALGLIYSLKVNRNHEAIILEPREKNGKFSLGQSFALLLVATIGVVFLSEILVGAVESVVSGLGLSEFFLGIILIPIIGNVAEHLVAVQVATRNQMDLSVEIAVSSSLQVALFVAPILVFISLLMGHPLTLIFNTFELIALGAGVLIVSLVSADGESTWFEGSALLAVYVIFAIAFFLLPTG